jgi:hypothetical protein
MNTKPINKLSRFGMALIAGLLSATLVYAQAINFKAQALTAGTAASVLTGRQVVDSLAYFNQNTTNVATLKFYDAATAVTNIVRPAYTAVVSYETNFTTITTNITGILQTNSFTGWYSGLSSISITTNERTRLGTAVVPPNTRLALPMQFLTAQGLTVLSDTAGILEVGYKGN